MKSLLALVSLLMVFSSSLSAQGAETSDAPAAITTKNAAIPVDQLQFLVMPLTQEELVIEANAWLKLLKAKVREISLAEVAVKKQNVQIGAAEEAAEAMEEAQEAAEEAKTAQAKTAGTNAVDVKKAQKATEEAQKKARQAAKAAEEAQEVSQESQQDTEVQEAVEQAAQKAEDKAREEAEEEGETLVETPAAKPVSTEIVPKVETQDVGNPDKMDEAVAATKKVAQSQQVVKTSLLDSLTELRTERTAIIDRFKVVLDELEQKGGEAKQYRQYIAAVSEVIVEVSDWEAVLNFGYGWLTSSEGGVRWGINLGQFVVIILGFYILSLIVGKIVRKATSAAKRMSVLLRAFLVNTAKRLVMFCGILMGLSAMEIQLGPLLALIGGAAFVVAFALQGTLSNFASGILILMYRPFDVGDVIDAAGVSGKVDAMNLVSTHIKTFDNKSITVPNNKIWGDVITNATASQIRRVDLVFGIGYGDSIEKAQEILERLVKDHPLILNTPETVIRVHELGDSSVNFICRPWSKTADYWSVYWDLTRQVKEEFDKNGVSIPFPQRDVHIYQEQGSDVTKA